MWKVCLFCSQNNKSVWLSNMADTFLEKFRKCAKDCGLFSWLCFRMLIGWVDKLRSRGCTSSRALATNSYLLTYSGTWLLLPMFGKSWTNGSRTRKSMHRPSFGKPEFAHGLWWVAKRIRKSAHKFTQVAKSFDLCRLALGDQTV